MRILIFKWLMLPMAPVLFFSCGEDDRNIIRCDDSAVVNEEIYISDSDPLTINYADILGNCLELRINFSGCSEDIEPILVASEHVEDSVFPPQREVKIFYQKDGDCEITFNRTLRVDLTPFQLADSDRVQLNLEMWEENLLYGY